MVSQATKRLMKLASQSAMMSLLGPELALEYLDVQQERLLRAGLSFNIALPGKIYQAIHIVNVF